MFECFLPIFELGNFFENRVLKVVNCLNIYKSDNYFEAKGVYNIPHSRKTSYIFIPPFNFDFSMLL